jgi:sec-independent protein translocase protein TatC
MSQDPEAATMTFWEHLAELRVRIVKMLLGYAVGVGAAWVYREALLEWLTRPFIEAWKSGKIAGSVSLHFAAPAALFSAYLKIALLGGVVLSLPIILYQIWMFISPGLYSREKRYAIPFVLASCLLFASGGYFGWKVAFPLAFQYLLGFAGPVGSGMFVVTPTVMIGDYIEFVLQMLVAFGVTFELPVLVFFLTVAGLVDHTHLIKYWRHFVVVAFIVGAVLSPPDVASQCLLSLPLCLLYGLSIGIAYVFRTKHPAAEPKLAG